MRSTLALRFGLAASIASAAWLSTTAAVAMSVSPTHIEMKSAGDSGRAQVTVHNDSAAPLPVEAIVKQLTIDENGHRSTSLDDSSFLVFPPQTMIPPGGSQVFRITWTGEPLIDQSKSFLLTIAQLPVKTQQQASNVQVVMAFGVIINVAPPKGEADLKVVSSGLTTDTKGRIAPTITVANPSKVHALLPQATIHLASGNWSQTLTPGVLGQKLGIGLVPPGKRRRFVLPVAVPQGIKDVRATIEYPRVKR